MNHTSRDFGDAKTTNETPIPLYLEFVFTESFRPLARPSRLGLRRRLGARPPLLIAQSPAQKIDANPLSLARALGTSTDCDEY